MILVGIVTGLDEGTLSGRGRLYLDDTVSYGGIAAGERPAGGMTMGQWSKTPNEMSQMGSFPNSVRERKIRSTNPPEADESRDKHELRSSKFESRVSCLENSTFEFDFPKGCLRHVLRISTRGFGTLSIQYSDLFEDWFVELGISSSTPWGADTIGNC